MRNLLLLTLLTTSLLACDDAPSRDATDAGPFEAGNTSAIAAEAGATYLLRGATLELAGQRFLKAEVVEVASGRVVAAGRVTELTEENLTAKLDELAGLVRQELEQLEGGGD